LADASAQVPVLEASALADALADASAQVTVLEASAEASADPVLRLHFRPA